MGISDIFSKRQKRLRGEIPDVYLYDPIPDAFRVQVVHIWRDAFGNVDRAYSPALEAYKAIHDVLCREYGVFDLGEGRRVDAALTQFFLTESDTDKVLDVIELSFRVIERAIDEYDYRSRAVPAITVQEAVHELNDRFLEHGLGYEYSAGELIRKDSEYLHTEAVKPALVVLKDAAYAGADEEFRNAHEHYRRGRHKESQNEALKALESTLKVICRSKGWSYKPTDTAKTLLDIAFRKELIPSYLQSEFTSLRATLESGIPTVRNKTSGHGQGPEPISVPQHLASYLLHLTAASILFLVRAASE